MAEERRTRRSGRARWRGRRAGTGARAGDVLVEICMTCGTERISDGAEQPADMQCAKCGGRVFRTFYDVRKRDEVHEDFLAATERDLAPDEAEADVSVDDILDLNNP